jgi:hypothetical protein
LVPTTGSEQLAHVPLLAGGLHPVVYWPLGHTLQLLLMHVPLLPSAVGLPAEAAPRKKPVGQVGSGARPVSVVVVHKLMTYCVLLGDEQLVVGHVLALVPALVPALE